MPENQNEEQQQKPLRNYRTGTAYFLMGNLVVFTSLGAGFIYLPAGLITLGVTSGLFGYLLGAD